MSQYVCAYLKIARAYQYDLIDEDAVQQGYDGLITYTKPYGNGDHIGYDTVLGTCKQVPSAAHARHDLIQNQEHPIAVADLADALEIGGHGGQHPGSGADHCLGDKGGHIFRAEGRSEERRVGKGWRTERAAE